MKKKILQKLLAAAVAATCATSSMVVSNFANAETNIKAEFEDGTVAGGADIMTADKDGNEIDYSGTGLVWLEDGGETASVNVTVETTGMYNLSISTYTPYGNKTHSLLINDVDQGLISFPENKTGFTESELGMFKLNAGENTITVKSSWGWTYLDYITITDASFPELNVTKTLSDKQATDETKRLMSYLVDVYGNHILSGQQEIYMYGPHDFEYEFEYIKNLTGVYPAIRGFDYLNECNILYGSEDGTTDRMIDWAKNKNGIITASWHVTVPKDFTNYELGVTSVDWNNATYRPDETDFNTANISDSTTKEYKYYMACLETLAASIKRLQDENIPIILRPLHEAEGSGGEDGSWFWWGKSGSEVYKKLWILTYKTLTEDYGLHNIIWEWNSYAYSTSANWYPGDEYVDIVAYDKYNCTDYSSGSAVLVHNDSAISGTFYNIVDLYDGKKMVAMAENDSVPTLENLTTEQAGWLYFCTWYDGAEDNIKFLSNPIFNVADDLKELYQSDYCISLDEIPEDLYNTYSLEGFDEEPTQPNTTEPTEAPTAEQTTAAVTTATDATEATTTSVSETTSVSVSTATIETTTTPATSTSEATTTTEPATAPPPPTEPITETETTTEVVPPSMYGDMNLDNIISATDVVILNKYLISQTEYPLPDKISYSNADCDLNGLIELSDSSLIVDCVIGSKTVADLGNNAELIN